MIAKDIKIILPPSGMDGVISLIENPIVAIDSDIYVYTAACICEPKVQLLKKDGKLIDDTFLYHQSKGYSVIDQIIGGIEKSFDAGKVDCYLSTTDREANYRNLVVGADKVYKENRKKRPSYYQHMRSYFINTFGAGVCRNDEADDVLGQLLYADYMNAYHSDHHDECNIVVASTDKDLWQFPGWIFNPTKRELSYSNFIGWLEYKKDKALLGRGFLFFCAQMIMGDTADNISGIKGSGAKIAFDALNGIDNFSDAWKKVVSLYQQKGVSEETIRAHATLLWITHEPGRLYPHNYLIEDMV